MHWNWQVKTEPGGPEQNMAADAALLAALADNSTSVPTVRVYTWNQNAVSIGRLQNEAAVRAIHPNLPIVRRPTGGRAVLHGEDLTISIALRLEWLPQECRSVLAAHHLLMEPVKAALEAAGRELCYGGCAINSQKNIVNCFDLAASCDLIDSHTGRKLVGSAQRREGNALLQQISLNLSLLGEYETFLLHLQTEFNKTFSSY
jgi:lipoate-protein ligase A